METTKARGTPRRTGFPFENLLRNNDLGIIENPLQRIEEDDLDRHVKEFHDEGGFDEEVSLKEVVDIEMLLKGAHLARDEEMFMAEEDLSDPERQALKRESQSTLWSEPKELRVILLTCFVAAIVQGWSQGAISGANQLWPIDFNLKTGLDNSQGDGTTGDLWRFSAVNAIAYFAASSIGAFICDPLTEIVTGRRGAIFASAVFAFAASIGAAYAQSWQGLFATRVLLGIGMGAKTSVVPVYASEVSPARLRGRFLISWQTGTALGIFLSSIPPLIAPGQWRFQISTSFIPALVLLFLVFIGSESPRWLIKKQRYAEAYKVLLRLRGNDLIAARDLIHIRAQLNIETILFMRTESDIFDMSASVPQLEPRIYRRTISLRGYGRRIIQLFAIPRARRAALAAFVVMSAQQLSGSNIFVFLAATLFDYNTSLSSKNSLWLFFGFGLSNTIFSAVSYFYIDSKGRRLLLVASLAAIIPVLLATGFSFLATDDNLRLALVSTFLVIFTFVYSPGAGTVPFLYTSEIFPQILREVGMAWGSAVAFFGAGLLDLLVPHLIHSIGQTAVLGLFAGLDAIALCLVWLFVPGSEREVSSVTMEEMNYIFGVSTRKHMHYQLYEVAPWCYRHYFLRQKVEKVPPLYRYARASDVNNSSVPSGGEIANGKVQ